MFMFYVYMNVYVCLYYVLLLGMEGCPKYLLPNSKLPKLQDSFAQYYMDANCDFQYTHGIYI